MSKFGKRPIVIPEDILLESTSQLIKAKGSLGEDSLEIPKSLHIIKKDDHLFVEVRGNNRKSRELQGLYRKLIINLLEGLARGFEKKLEFKGVGFRAEVHSDKLILNLGFSHPIEISFPQEIQIKVEKNIITVFGKDKQQVGQIAANIRALRPVEPYKGKGIKYLDEIPRRKPGKATKAVVGTGQ